MVSQLTTLSWSRPLRGPTGTSLTRPRTVLVIGATVTQPIRGSTAGRVRITAGRGLSRRTRAIERIQSSFGCGRSYSTSKSG